MGDDCLFRKITALLIRQVNIRMVISKTIKIVLTYNKNRITEQYRFDLAIN